MISSGKQFGRRLAGELVLLLLAGLFLTACGETNAPTTPTSAPPLTVAASKDQALLVGPTVTPNTSDNVIADRLSQVQAALKQNPPVLALKDGLDDNQRIAQEVALASPNFQRYMFAPSTNTPVRTEVFGIYPLRDSDLTQATATCQPATNCYRIEMYNYAFNLTARGFVDVKNRKLLSANTLPDTQPDIPDNLKNLAIHIATASPQLATALGYKPGDNQALMSNTKTSLNRTRCERSQHLCVAPTFVQGEDALWAIVDLTDLNLVGLQWTKVGQSSPLPITEKNLQDRAVTQQFCEHTTPLSRNGWQMDYILTSSDGLRVSDVSFQGRPVLRSAKLIDWHVSYSSRAGFGYSDAVGCPVFSQAAVVAVGGPLAEALPPANGVASGFSLTQDYWSIGWPAPCNYYYRQRFEFHDDGSFRVTAASIGRGCGNDGTYRPVTRLAFAGDHNAIAEWNGQSWQNWQIEKWQLQTPQTAYTPEGYQYRLSDNNGQGYYLEPGRGQFGDGGRGDNAYLFATRYHSDLDEGDSDLPTLGGCCNTDYHQGPERFIEPNPEPLGDSGLVLWYVAQLKNDDTAGQAYCWAQSVIESGLLNVKQYPCYSGPLFVPLKK